ncbi:PRS53 protease, partial [Mesembrinibis cayennensis]|nr:PRS53 protease [Mesembrinibis cayennensis]
GAYVEPGGGRDLALLHLETPLPLGPALRPLCLPYDKHQRPPGTRCWALLAHNGERPGPRGTIPGVPPIPGVPIFPGVLIPGPDGGSPVACEERGIWFLAGTASVGGCTQGGPPLFPAAPHYERWIAGITREAYFSETPPDPREEEEEEEEATTGDPGLREHPATSEDPDIGGEPEPTEDP